MYLISLQFHNNNWQKTLKTLTSFNRESASQASSGQIESCKNLQTAGTSAIQNSETGIKKQASQSIWAALSTCEIEKKP